MNYFFVFKQIETTSDSILYKTAPNLKLEVPF
jgi:hypothetical protein